ncbi:MAG: arginine--tRNA ligase [Candidatus Nanoarchaeia archaeon]
MFESHIVDILRKELKTDNIKLEVPPDPILGDFAFPCFSLAKAWKKDPKQIASELAARIKPTTFISEIRSNGPYLNFFVNKAKFSENIISNVLKLKSKYGSSNLGKGQKVLIEHTSINPNASPHVGRARNAIIGDSLVRIFKFQGYKVETHYFVNDVGKQVAMLVYAAKNRKPSFEGLLNLYVDVNKKVKEDPSIEKEIFDLLYKLEKEDAKVKKRFKDIVDISVKGQRKIFADLGIKYDFFDYESKYLWDKSTKDVLSNLEKFSECFVDADGRKVLNQEEFKNEMKAPYLVLTRSDGTSLYALRDLAYTIEKMRRSKNNIIVLGEEQKLYFKQLCAALKLLGKPCPRVVHYSFVLLTDGTSMSTREGNVVLLTDFMKELISKANKEVKSRTGKSSYKSAKIIGLGALKYSFLRVSNDKNVTFDWSSALSFEGDTGPYIQYAHARASSILRKAKFKPGKFNSSLLSKEQEFSLVKQIGSFPKVVSEAESALHPHLIANYLYNLAKLFSEFYHNCQCIGVDKEISKARLALVFACKQVLANGMGLLGIEAPDRM